ncbi:hypothetical protein FDENT_14069, partial [Fusarium denticulatum]
MASDYSSSSSHHFLFGSSLPSKPKDKIPVWLGNHHLPYLCQGPDPDVAESEPSNLINNKRKRSPTVQSYGPCTGLITPDISQSTEQSAKCRRSSTSDDGTTNSPMSHGSKSLKSTVSNKSSTAALKWPSRFANNYKIKYFLDRPQNLPGSLLKFKTELDEDATHWAFYEPDNDVERHYELPTPRLVDNIAGWAIKVSQFSGQECYWSSTVHVLALKEAFLSIRNEDLVHLALG